MRNYFNVRNNLTMNVQNDQKEKAKKAQNEIDTAKNIKI